MRSIVKHILQIGVKNGYQLLAILLLCAVSCDTKDSVAPEEEVAFIKFFGGLGDQEGIGLVELDEGGFVVLGHTNSFGSGGNDLFVIRTDELGNEIWNNTYGGTGDDFGGAIILDPADGNLLAVGTKGNSDSDVYLLKINTNDGSVIWQNDTIGFRGFNETGSAITMTSDGGIIVTGSTTNFANQNGLRVRDTYSVKLSSSGVVEWDRRDGFGNDFATDIVQFIESGEEVFVLFGTTREPLPDIPNGTNYLLVKFKNDEEVISQKPLGEESDQQSGRFIHTANGGFVLSGTTKNSSASGGNDEIYIVRADKDFNKLSESKIGGNAKETGFGIQALSNGSFLISGSTNSFGIGQSDIYLINIDAGLSPLQQWEQSPRVFGGTGNDFGSQVISTKDGGFAVVGNSTFGNNNNVMISLVKTNKDGVIDE